MTFKQANLIGTILSFAMIVTALVIQLKYELEPCPLCITQRIIYIVLGSIFLIFIWLWIYFPQFENPVEQHKKLILRKRYWLYYLLTFFSGARRQIFIVFAGFMMVEKFHYDASDIALLFIINHLFNLYAAPKLGELVGKIGEQKALTIEYVGLMIVFVGYALVESAEMAAFLYVVDHLFFALAIAIKTFFQKIADPADIASTASVSFTINHIAAVVIPAAFGLMWLVNPSYVFLSGALMAFGSLLLAQFVDKELMLNNAEGLVKEKGMVV